MPLYYDVARTTATNATGNTESTHLWGHTVANQETATVLAVYVHAQNFGTAGSGLIRMKTPTTTASGGTSQTPAPKNARLTAAQSLWLNDTTTITAGGGTVTVRESIGWAQTGGMGGWVALTPQQGLQMMPFSLNPIDVEFTSLAFSPAVPIDLVVDFSEGV